MSNQMVRMAAPVADNEAVYRLLTIKGRTGNFVGFKAINSEKATDVAQAVRETLTAPMRAQVESMSFDHITPSLYQELTKPNACPNLKFLAVDAMHIVFAWRAANFKKHTEASEMLTQLMRKLHGEGGGGRGLLGARLLRRQGAEVA